MRTRLRKDDTVQIMTGKDKGKRGKILLINRDSGRVVVQGFNMVKKAVKPKKQNEKGGIIDVEAPLSISNVMVVCRKCGPTRIGMTVESSEKTRTCRKCGETL